MSFESIGAQNPVFLPKTELSRLVEFLRQDGYQVLGPVLEDGVVMLRPIESADELARGVRDEQTGGFYRTTDGDPSLYFAEYTVGPESPKRYLFPPEQRLFGLHVEGDQFVVDEGSPQPPKLAFLGLRSCELAGIAVQDRVFGALAKDGEFFRCELEAYYKQAREAAFIVAVHCTQPGGTCFCASMGTGPEPRAGFDLSLLEEREGFIAQAGSERGKKMLSRLVVREPSSAEVELAELRLKLACEQMGKRLETEGIPQILDKSIEHPRWDDVAKRCLGCGNCTLVCPTCFCHSFVDESDPQSKTMYRKRTWDVCYTLHFSYLTDGPVRNSIRGRYRHWLRHKLGTWHEQFGCSGCVGCGRCITWCPVGIDITEEMAAIRQQRDDQVEKIRPQAGKACEVSPCCDLRPNGNPAPMRPGDSTHPSKDEAE